MSHESTESYKYHHKKWNTKNFVNVLWDILQIETSIMHWNWHLIHHTISTFNKQGFYRIWCNRALSHDDIIPWKACPYCWFSGWARHRSVNSLRPSDAYMRQLLNHHWFRQWLVAWSAPSHYLNQWWNIVNSNLRNKLQWNLKQNS